MTKMLSWGLILSLVVSFGTGCAGHERTAKGAGIGAAAGAVVGGLWGAARGNWKEGAAIGAGVGAAIGGVTGAVMDKQANDLRKAGIRADRDDAGNLVIQLTGDTLKFDTGKANLKPEGEATLDKLATVIAKYPENRIMVSGHTDNLGSASFNTTLSQNRADRVKAYLLGKGIPPRCILSSTGYGPDQPVADNSTEAGRAANRRVELKISVDQDEAEKNEKERERLK